MPAAITWHPEECGCFQSPPHRNHSPLSSGAGRPGRESEQCQEIWKLVVNPLKSPSLRNLRRPSSIRCLQQESRGATLFNRSVKVYDSSYSSTNPRTSWSVTLFTYAANHLRSSRSLHSRSGSGPRPIPSVTATSRMLSPKRAILAPCPSCRCCWPEPYIQPFQDFLSCQWPTMTFGPCACVC